MDCTYKESIPTGFNNSSNNAVELLNIKVNTVWSLTPGSYNICRTSKLTLFGVSRRGHITYVRETERERERETYI